MIFGDFVLNSIVVPLVCKELEVGNATIHVGWVDVEHVVFDKDE